MNNNDQMKWIQRQEEINAMNRMAEAMNNNKYVEVTDQGIKRSLGSFISHFIQVILTLVAIFAMFMVLTSMADKLTDNLKENQAQTAQMYQQQIRDWNNE